jgi:hypothetical protein
MPSPPAAHPSPPPADPFARLGGANVTAQYLVEHGAQTAIRRSGQLVHAPGTHAKPEDTAYLQKRAEGFMAAGLKAGLTGRSLDDFTASLPTHDGTAPPGQSWAQVILFSPAAPDYRDKDHAGMQCELINRYDLAGLLFRCLAQQSRIFAVLDQCELSEAFELFLWPFHSADIPRYDKNGKGRHAEANCLCHEVGQWLLQEWEGMDEQLRLGDSNVLKPGLVGRLADYLAGWHGRVFPLLPELLPAQATLAYTRGKEARAGHQAHLDMIYRAHGDSTNFSGSKRAIDGTIDLFAH